MRLNVRGSLIELPAYSSAGPLPRGLAVIVVEMRGGDVWLLPFSQARTVSSPDPHHD